MSQDAVHPTDAQYAAQTRQLLKAGNLWPKAESLACVLQWSPDQTPAQARQYYMNHIRQVLDWLDLDEIIAVTYVATNLMLDKPRKWGEHPKVKKHGRRMA